MPQVVGFRRAPVQVKSLKKILDPALRAGSLAVSCLGLSESNRNPKSHNLKWLSEAMAAGANVMWSASHRESKETFDPVARINPPTRAYSSRVGWGYKTVNQILAFAYRFWPSLPYQLYKLVRNSSLRFLKTFQVVPSWLGSRPGIPGHGSCGPRP